MRMSTCHYTLLHELIWKRIMNGYPRGIKAKLDNYGMVTCIKKTILDLTP